MAEFEIRHLAYCERCQTIVTYALSVYNNSPPTDATLCHVGKQRTWPHVSTRVGHSYCVNAIVSTSSYFYNYIHPIVCDVRAPDRCSIWQFERVSFSTVCIARLQHRNLTPSTPAVPNCCCSKGSAPYWSNPPLTRHLKTKTKTKTYKNGLERP